MVNWKELNTVNQIEEIKQASSQIPILIFKHSTRCSISALAKHRLESQWDFSEEELHPYYLDLISYRDVSNAIATAFDVYHESPQVLLIRDGVCTYDASHMDISVAELHECYSHNS